MERLTKRDTDGQAMMDCQKCEADWTGKHCKPMANCTALYCRNRLKDRLAAYEDTGLEPEKVLPKDKADEIALKLMRIADLESLCSYDRLRELAEADRNHQIVIRPCKIGDTVWAADTEPVIPLHVMADAVYLEGRHGGDYERLSNFGSVVFLSQEEAKEAASHWMN